MKTYHSYPYLVILLLSLILSNEVEYLVKIDNKIITVNEFIKRAEYTIRPKYCKGNNQIHKKIILNSLIAEKLMAIDIENNLLADSYTNHYIEGIKEQKMREVLLEDEVYKKINIDSTLIMKHLEYSTREYEIEYLSFDNDNIGRQVISLFASGKNFNYIAEQFLELDNVPQKKISYLNEKDPNIHNEFFSKDLLKNQVLGPIYSKDNKILFVKILNYIQTPLVTDYYIDNQIKIIEDKLLENAYMENYDNYIGAIMQGIELRFLKDSYKQLIEKTILQFENIPGDYDFKSISQIDILFGIDNFDNELLIIEDVAYTFKDIDNLIKKHPLVFRKTKTNQSSYPIDLKYAIVDLLRDEYLNKLAYKKKYDTHPLVLNEVEMFRDANLSNFHLQTYLKGKKIEIEYFNKNYLKIINSDLNDYIESLFNKYSSNIYIDFDNFSKINLTNIDLYAYKQGFPYSDIVPAFPVLTDKYIINYGNQISIP